MLEFPALFTAADIISARAQREYLWLVAIEYMLLFLAAILTLQATTYVPFLIFYALVFMASLGVMLFRTLRKPEQDWYKCRALAESIKTTTWRYAMRAQPFDDAKKSDARKDFGKFLKNILSTNQHIGPRIAALKLSAEQITSTMDEIRSSALDNRKEIYLSDRIIDQQNWYGGKARYNTRRMKMCIWVCALFYAVAIVFVIAKIPHPASFLPTEPLIVLASSIIGWMQIRKFNELASAYALTAYEISLVREDLKQVKDEKSFSAFVNEAERAFSREHTQWVARLQ